MNSPEEIRVQGVSLSEGIAMGIPFFLSISHEEGIPEFRITTGEVEGEIERYRRALFSSREDLEKLQKDLGSCDAKEIIESHIQMLSDPLMTDQMEDKIRQMHQNTESVFRSVISDYEKKFTEAESHFFQERLDDVKDLRRRILSHLYPTSQKKRLSEIPSHSVVFAKQLAPSDTAEHASAFVTQTGGGNSHAALIARSKGIPYISSIDIKYCQSLAAGYVIVDGKAGLLILNPLKSTQEQYEAIKRKQHVHIESPLKAETRDGFAMTLLANIGSLSEIEDVHACGADGIGLFRSEYLLFNNEALLYSEEDQFQIYKETVERAKGLPVTIRAFDIGGDKRFHFSTLSSRGARFLLLHEEIFKTQLKALLRASKFGPLSLLIPHITEIEELLALKQRIHPQLPIGCMIETPTAVLACEQLAQESDFLSIGTNDLTHYVLGIDRADSDLSLHPDILRMIKKIATSAQNKPVSICGEIASNPLILPLLMGLGITLFSCRPSAIPQLKRTIQKTNLKQATLLAQQALTLQSSDAILKFLQENK